MIPTLAPAHLPSADKEADLTVIIAHRGPMMGLWATLHSVYVELEPMNLDYNFVVVVNGEKHSYEHDKMKREFGRTGRLRDWIYHEAPLSPPSARELGTKSANGKLFFFFDNHCLVQPGYFKHALAAFENPDVHELHSTTFYYAGMEPAYHYKLTLEKNFWGTCPPEPIDAEKPYRCAMGGHGGFAVRRDVWRAVDGYWEGFEGYAGEEPYFDLKMWLMGYQVWVHPKMIHYHFAGERPYARHCSDGYYKNMFMAAHIIGGTEWMDKLFPRFSNQPRLKESEVIKPLYDLMTEAYDRSKARAAWLAKRRTQSLDELLSWFGNNGVAH